MSGGPVGAAEVGGVDGEIPLRLRAAKHRAAERKADGLNLGTLKPKTWRTMDSALAWMKPRPRVERNRNGAAATIVEAGLPGVNGRKLAKIQARVTGTWTTGTSTAGGPRAGWRSDGANRGSPKTRWR